MIASMRGSNNIIMTDSHSRDLPPFRASLQGPAHEAEEAAIGRCALFFPWLP
jgi:hypothetical protein